MKGLIEEGAEALQENEVHVRDLPIMAAAQRRALRDVRIPNQARRRRYSESRSRPGSYPCNSGSRLSYSPRTRQRWPCLRDSPANRRTQRGRAGGIDRVHLRALPKCPADGAAISADGISDADSSFAAPMKSIAQSATSTGVHRYHRSIFIGAAASPYFHQHDIQSGARSNPWN